MKKILIADSDKKVYNQIASIIPHEKATLLFATDGIALLETFGTFSPDLCLIALDLPKMHGIEAVKRIRALFNTSAPLILLGYSPLVSDIQSAFAVGAAAYLLKHDAQKIAEQILSFVNGESPDFDLDIDGSFFDIDGPLFTPDPPIASHYLKFWGTRGSVPVSGPQYIHYGGNTSCLEVRSGEDLLIIDAGSGIRQLGEELLKTKGVIHLVISHTHWDHILAFPFFAPLYQSHRKIIVWAPVSYEEQTSSLFSSLFKTSFFPVRIDEICASLEFRNLVDGTKIEVGSITLSCHYTLHPGPTLGFVIGMAGQKIGYITDNEILYGYHGPIEEITPSDKRLDPHRRLFEALSCCDLLIHEAQYSPKEYLGKVGWGHSSLSNACYLLHIAAAKRWIVTHHDPAHTDADLTENYALHRQIIQQMGKTTSLQLAYDGLKYALDPNNVS